MEGDVLVNGVRLHYTAAGDPDAPLVLLLHGFPESSYSWRHQLPALAGAGFFAVAPDLRGYGRSERPAGTTPYRLQTLVADVAGMVDALGRGRPAAAIVGHDWGGVLAWATGALAPEVTRRLCVVNGPHPLALRRALRPRSQSGWRFPTQPFRSWYVLFFQLPWLPELLLRAGRYRFVDVALRPAAQRNPAGVTPADVARTRAEIARPGALTAAINYYRALFRNDPRQVQRLRRAVRRIEAPALVIWAGRDPYLGPELLDGLDRWVPHLRVERLPAAGHFCHQEEPDRVNRLLAQWAGSAVGREPGRLAA